MNTPIHNSLNIQTLNNQCFCISLDDDALRAALESELGSPGLSALIKERCPYLFSARPLFVSAQHRDAMAAIIAAVESVVALPAWRDMVLARAGAIVRGKPGAKGVFLGYDFHVNESRLGLIEINTNAGGAMLNAILARAQRACCPEVADVVPAQAAITRLEEAMVAMFRNEWHLSGRDRPLATIAIVDEEPREQYLYPEFILFQQLFQRCGITAVIAAPEELEFAGGTLWYGDRQIDLVYNRLTDFLLEQPGNAVLRQAYLEQAIVLTPHPQAHALYGDKRNLAVLSDAGALEALGVPENIRHRLLTGIPHTEIVDPRHADRLWAQRRQLFFKPASGYGSRAAYRGEKLTKRVWQQILEGDYVAQDLVLPGERAIGGGVSEMLKFDLRNYVYDGAVQWIAARLYQGQTTNFRTPGGGFAPVYIA
ncbi:MAG: hypothetical protein M0Q95_04045 [Porticoccaceae bacterium]|nr:hypothetical protein [Porticoccaceae bacterium]